MKNFTICILIVFYTISTVTLINYKIKITNYVIDTETMLDSLGIEGDNPIFDTEVGKKYLDSKETIDF